MLAGCDDNSSNMGLSLTEPSHCADDPSEIDLLSADVSSKIDQLVATALSSMHVSGLSVGVAQDGKAVFAKGYGLANIANDTPVCADTPFELGSVTKSFTAIGLLLILDNPGLNKSNLGTLDLESPISQYLSPNPEFTLPSAWENITTEQLLSMSSGIPDFGSNTLTWQQILDKIGKEPLLFTPGTGYCYSNPSFMVIGEIIQQLTETPYAEFMNEEVFTPLGMNDTIIHTPDNTPSDLATGYEFDEKTMTWNTPSPRPPTSSFSAGAIISTAVDLSTFLAALQQELLLKPSTYDLMWSVINPVGEWGLGWQVSVTDQYMIYRKDGDLPGFGAQISLYQGDKVYVAIASNEEVPYVELAAQIVAAVIGAEKVPNPPGPGDGCIPPTPTPSPTP
jgi:CubicO group peptidase (beta-lactamase class C family)